jgi:hypothetical protein
VAAVAAQLKARGVRLVKDVHETLWARAKSSSMTIRATLCIWVSLCRRGQRTSLLQPLRRSAALQEPALTGDEFRLLRHWNSRPVRRAIGSWWAGTGPCNLRPPTPYIGSRGSGFVSRR